MSKIFFDMDGTIANLYGVENWLEYLINENPYPYANAKPLVRMSNLARLLNKLQRNGYEIGIISWLAKNSNSNYDEMVINAKMEWLNKHLASVKFDEIHIVKYGTPKQMFASADDILFDDEKPNRENWIGKAYDVENILEILRNL